ncbi:stage III sporulation protein AH [Weizmannia acidilactici]|uniref:Stage III sporulation protein AH n=1 Tax=Weizmannia acidilactici TaxID=2607726 RepID=A0A5J4JF70_9BACI|nr:SpoIIIAH-like family protein [Weizmannia acidilactici]GER66139.1 stage III sporulation protein AH [Weizmannia acidilactici]GER69225.1 stage III sporulation protein AH [Weizmannia acidilactici]GER72448.1 stage III sporulation protein AH [Weizmannia acidilactici]
MLLKKQTVWLLTMLSLVVVLSVYYVTADPKTTNQVVQQNKEKETSSSKENASSSQKIKLTTKPASDEVFEALRLERQDELSKKQEELTNKLASTDLTPEEKSKAMDEMKKLTETANKEQVLESLIKAKGYEDALVQADSDEVIVTVKSKKHDKAAANEIVQLVNQELGNTPKLAVEFQTN